MNPRLAMILAVVLALAMLGSASTFVVSEVDQVVLTEFGSPRGKPITDAGLHFKRPWYKARVFDRRILRWDGEPKEIPTRDKKFIHVDTTARWRIVDPLKFLVSVRDEAGAQARLDTVINAAVRDAITDNPLIEVVRSDNQILDAIRKSRETTKGPAAPTEEKEGVRGDDLLREVKLGRNRLTEMVREKSTVALREEFGIELVDVRIKRINYRPDVQKSVYSRMVSERKKEAERYRSQGHGRAAAIRGEMERKLKEIQSGAYRDARGIEGEADAKATKIYADAYGRDPDFYAFLRSLESYRTTLTGKTRLILTTDSKYLRYLKEDR